MNHKRPIARPPPEPEPIPDPKLVSVPRSTATRREDAEMRRAAALREKERARAELRKTCGTFVYFVACDLSADLSKTFKPRARRPSRLHWRASQYPASGTTGPKPTLSRCGDWR